MRRRFIENQGQVADAGVKYYAKTFGGAVFVTGEGEIVYSLPKQEREKEDNAQHSTLNAQHSTGETAVRGGVLLRERLVGAKPAVPAGVDKAATKVSFFKGNDPAKWKTGLASWDSVSLGEVYPGIELSLKAHGNNVEKVFTVTPGAEPGLIRISVVERTSKSVHLAEEEERAAAFACADAALRRAKGMPVLRANGQLVIPTELGDIAFTAPIVPPWTSHFHVVGDGGFGHYDLRSARRCCRL